MIRLIVLRKKTCALVLLLFILALGTVTLCNSGLLSAIPVISRQERLVPIYYVETPEKKIAISFDASWGAAYTPTLLEILRENNITTTFFLTGFWVEKYPEMVKEIAAAGHEIGNHTYSHPHLNSLEPDQIKAELERVGHMIYELTERQPDLFRPPFGEYSNKVIQTAEQCGYRTIQWSVDSLDWQELGVEPMVKRVTDKLHPGAIVLFHNNGRYTAEALPDIIDYAREHGYEIVPISELLYKDNYFIDGNSGAQIKKEE
ncbi:MAG: polysaccharide deacetylase family protein [Bacillota bacterium]